MMVIPKKSDQISFKIITPVNDAPTFQFPLHWGSVPTILKGWFDRILLTEFAFILPDCRYEKGLLKVRNTF